MEQITNDTMNTVIATNPQLFMQFSIIIFAVVIVLVIIFSYYKFIKPAIEEYERKDNVPCQRDCIYKNDFKKNTEEIKGINQSIHKNVTVFENISSKIDVNVRENRESFSHIIRMAEKQNDVLVELSSQTKMHTQLLLNIKNKE